MKLNIKNFLKSTQILVDKLNFCANSESKCKL